MNLDSGRIWTSYGASYQLLIVEVDLLELEIIIKLMHLQLEWL